MSRQKKNGGIRVRATKLERVKPRGLKWFKISSENRAMEILRELKLELSI